LALHLSNVCFTLFAVTRLGTRVLCSAVVRYWADALMRAGWNHFDGKERAVKHYERGVMIQQQETER
jgi:hypothetical protein